MPRRQLAEISAGAGEPEPSAQVRDESDGFGTTCSAPAKRRGAYVTGVDNAAKLDFMRSVGAEAGSASSP